MMTKAKLPVKPRTEMPQDMRQLAIDTLMAKGTPFAAGLAAEIDRGRRRANRETAPERREGQDGSCQFCERTRARRPPKANESAWARLGERVREWMAPRPYEPGDGEKVWFRWAHSPRVEFDWMPGIVHRPLTPDLEEYIIWLEGDPMRGQIVSAESIEPY